MNKIYSLVAVTLLGSMFALQASAATQVPGEATSRSPAMQTFNATVPASGLNNLVLHFNIGDATIRSGSDNTIHIQAQAQDADNTFHFIFTWTEGKPNSLPPGLRLIQQRNGDTLSLCLGVNKCGDAGESDNNWKGVWTITLPARMHIKLEGNIGKGSVTGVAGGVNINLNIGKLDLRLPCGPIQGNVNIGKLVAQIAAAQYGAVKLSANIGHVNFSVNGDDVEQGYERQVVSVAQSLRGSGSTPYSLAVNTGDVELALGVADIPTSSYCTNPSAPAASTSR